jgi:hypothetical protein
MGGLLHTVCVNAHIFKNSFLSLIFVKKNEAYKIHIITPKYGDGDKIRKK